MLRRSIVIRESAQQWRTPTWDRAVAGVKRWKLHHQEKRRQAKEKLRARTHPGVRSKWWEKTRFWRHLQSQVKPNHRDRRHRTADHSARARESSSDTSSPFRSERALSAAGSVSISLTDILRPVSTASGAKLREGSVIPVQDQDEGEEIDSTRREEWEKQLKKLQQSNVEALTEASSSQSAKLRPVSTSSPLDKHESPPSSAKTPAIEVPTFKMSDTDSVSDVDLNDD